MRRRFKAVVDVLDAMIRYGISLARSVELTAQWDRILAIGPLYPVTFGDLDVVRGVGVGEFHRIVPDVHRRLSDFVEKLLFIVGMRLLGCGVIGFGRILCFTLTSGSGLIWFPLPISSV